MQWPNGLLIALVVMIGSRRADADDWPMRGRDCRRNAVSLDQNGPVDWKLTDAADGRRHVRWSAELGSESCGDPVIANGLVWVGTNNSRPRDSGNSGDASVLMCFDEKDGAFLYQFVSPRLDLRRELNSVRDWPRTSLASSPLVEGDRLWFCTNRCEVICLDISQLRTRAGPATIVWKVDMATDLGVVPRPVMLGSSASHCSIASHKDLIYVNTTNGAGPKGVQAPSLLCLEKQSGAIRWSDRSPGAKILDVQHGSPMVFETNGHAQVVMGQGDGWVRGFDAQTGNVLWKFDINAKSAERIFSIDSKRSDLVAMPVLYDGLVYFGVGRQIELCGGPGRLCCVDPTRRGDVSPEIEDRSGRKLRNPDSGLVWEYRGGGDEGMQRTLSSVVIHKGLVFAPDRAGVVHCLDAKTGRLLWKHETNSQISTSPLIVGTKLYVGTDDEVFIFDASRSKKLIARLDAHDLISASPVFANRSLYITTRSTLYRIAE